MHNKIPKTVPKLTHPTSSSLLFQNTTTAQPFGKKCKSLKLENHIFLQKQGKSYAFPIYHDN